MAYFHAIIWIDHHKAVVWSFGEDEQSKAVVKAPDQHAHAHLRKSPHGGHRAAGDHEFFGEVLESLEGAQMLLIIGPAQTKEEFATFLRTRHPQVGSLIVGVENADHPTDAQLLAYARKHFKILERMI